MYQGAGLNLQIPSFLYVSHQIRCKFKFFFLIFQENRNFFLRKCVFFVVSQSFLVSLRQI